MTIVNTQVIFNQIVFLEKDEKQWETGWTKSKLIQDGRRGQAKVWIQHLLWRACENTKKLNRVAASNCPSFAPAHLALLFRVGAVTSSGPKVNPSRPHDPQSTFHFLEVPLFLGGGLRGGGVLRAGRSERCNNEVSSCPLMAGVCQYKTNYT